MQPPGTRRAWLRAAAVLLIALVVAAAAHPVHAGTQSRAKVSNAEPQVVSVLVLTDDDSTQGGAQIDPTAGGLRGFDVEFEVEDRNHHEDLASAGCTTYTPDGSVHEEVGAVFRDGQGKRSMWDTSGTIESHDPPGFWRIVCHAYDETMVEENRTRGRDNMFEATFEVRTLAAIQIRESVVDFTSGGTMDPGTTTTPSSITIENMGNVQVDLEVSGTDLVGDAATIAVERVLHALNETMSPGAALSTSGTTVSDFDLAAGEGSTKPLWFTLTIPSGEDQFIPAGTYSGTVTITALQDMG